jgi:hypothetical protein
MPKRRHPKAKSAIHFYRLYKRDVYELVTKPLPMAINSKLNSLFSGG